MYDINNNLVRDAVERHTSAKDIKSLVGEIGVLRSLFEKRVNNAGSDPELVQATPALKDLAIAIQKLVESTHSMDMKLGNVIGKQALVSLAHEIIQIIYTQLQPLADRVPQHDLDDAVEAIGTRIVDAIAEQENSG